MGSTLVVVDTNGREVSNDDGDGADCKRQKACLGQERVHAAKVLDGALMSSVEFVPSDRSGELFFLVRCDSSRRKLRRGHVEVGSTGTSRGPVRVLHHDVSESES